MKVTIIGQIKNKGTGLGKAINDFRDYCCNRATRVTEIDITNNFKFLSSLFQILISDTDVYYFTPAGSVAGNIRDSLFLFFMIMKRKKIVTHFHNSAFGNVMRQHPTLMIINRILYSKVDLIILLGEKSKIMFQQLRISDEKFKIIRNGVDRYLFIEKNELNKKMSELPINIIFFSNMIREKGYEILLEVAKKMREDEKYHFYFSGKFQDNNLKTRFINEIYSMNNVTYLDGVYGSDKKKLLQKMHYFVLPSYYKDETLPISMLEAMANGLYIIVSDVGVVSEVINKETASLIEMINEETADSIIEIIDQTSNKLNELDFNVSKYKQELLNENIQASIYQQLERIAN